MTLYRTEETSQTKKGRPKKTKVQSSQETSNEQSGASQSQESKEDDSQSQGSKEGQEADGMSEAFSKKEEQTAEELEEEKRIREEYREEEKSLIDEIYNNAVVCSEVPIGMDRIYSRYWSLKYVDGLFVENDEQGQKLAEFAGEEKIDDDYDCTDDPARVSYIYVLEYLFKVPVLNNIMLSVLGLFISVLRLRCVMCNLYFITHCT